MSYCQRIKAHQSTTYDGASTFLSAGRQVTLAIGAFQVAVSSVRHCVWLPSFEQLNGFVTEVVVVPLKRMLQNR